VYTSKRVFCEMNEMYEMIFAFKFYFEIIVSN